MQDEKMLLPERADAPETAVKNTMIILPTGDIPLLNTIADTAMLCEKFNV